MTPEAFAKQFCWSAETLQVAMEAKFRCVYCGHKFFESVDAWTQFNVDHLRPGSNKTERDERIENKVAACWTCNKIKASFDPGAEEVGASRERLIAIAKRYIEEARLRRGEKVTAMKSASQQWRDDA
jgi:5-methylcytosine-specific restriction endonuclease McrA